MLHYGQERKQHYEQRPFLHRLQPASHRPTAHAPDLQEAHPLRQVLERLLHAQVSEWDHRPRSESLLPSEQQQRPKPKGQPQDDERPSASEHHSNQLLAGLCRDSNQCVDEDGLLERQSTSRQTHAHRLREPYESEPLSPTVRA